MPGIDPTTDCFIGPGKSFIAFWHDSGGWPVLTVHVDRGSLPNLQAMLRIYNDGPFRHMTPVPAPSKKPAVELLSPRGDSVTYAFDMVEMTNGAHVIAYRKADRAIAKLDLRKADYLRENETVPFSSLKPDITDRLGQLAERQTTASAGMIRRGGPTGMNWKGEHLVEPFHALHPRASTSGAPAMAADPAGSLPRHAAPGSSRVNIEDEVKAGLGDTGLM